MPNYKLNILFSQEDLSSINGVKERVILVKHSTNTDQPLSWVAFEPFKTPTNEWETQFSIHSHTGELSMDPSIKKLYLKEADTQITYNFDDSIFKTGDTDVTNEKNTFILEDSKEKAAHPTLGMSQRSVVNRTAFKKNPIPNSVPYGNTVDITPLEVIDAYNRNRVSNESLNYNPAKELTLPNSNSCTEITIRYNANTGKFEISESE